MAPTATRKFLMFSKYCIADWAAASEDWTAIIGFSTTWINKRKKPSRQIVFFYVGSRKWIKKLGIDHGIRTLRTAPGLTLLRTLQRMRPLRRARQKSSSDGSLGSDAHAPWSICLSHSAAWHLLEAEIEQPKRERL